MILKEFLAALAVTLLVCTLFVLATRSRVRRTGFGWLFLFVLLATWAGGVWLRPFGPALGDIRWLQFLIVGLLAVVLLAWFAPFKPPRGRHDTLDQLRAIARQKELNRVTFFTLGIVFWVVLVILIAAIAIRYIAR